MSIHVEKSVSINRSPEDLYQFWRNFENLPRFMNHLQSVEVLDQRRSHWVTKAPLGTQVQWDAEITEERENEFIAWRSLEGADVNNSGWVEFQPRRDGTTEVRVNMEYDPPGGMAGAVIATIFNEAPDQQLAEDLFRLKQELELPNGAASQV